MFATLFKLALYTGSRETWGQITVTLITENDNRFAIYSKASVRTASAAHSQSGRFPDQSGADSGIREHHQGRLVGHGRDESSICAS